MGKIMILFPGTPYTVKKRSFGKEYFVKSDAYKNPRWENKKKDR
jgi:hypothetical protein